MRRVDSKGRDGSDRCNDYQVEVALIQKLMKVIFRKARITEVLLMCSVVYGRPVMGEQKIPDTPLYGVEQRERDYSKKNLDGLTEELLRYNSQLQSLAAKINAAHAFIPQASALDDPRLSFEASNIPVDNPSFHRTPMTGMQIYLRQRIPFPGKLGLKKKIAESREAQAVEEHLETLNQLVAKFKGAFYDYAFIFKAVDISQKTIGRLQALTKNLEAKYAVGEVPQQDVLKTKVELSKMRERLIRQDKMKDILASRITTLLHRPGKTPLKIVVSKTTLTGLPGGLEDLLKVAQNSRHWLNRADKIINEAEYQHALSKKELLPDFDFSVGYRLRSNAIEGPVLGEDFFSAGVSVNIPVWTTRKQGKRVEQTRYLVTAARKDKESIEQETIYQVERLFFEVTRLKEQYELYRSRIVPESESALVSSRRSYEANEVDYLNVITNELNLFQVQLLMHQYYFEHEKKIAELEMAIGKPLAALSFTGDAL
ncbi:MAG: TolC family protein [Chlorobium phaeobacteroides]|nr:TolC family protein [Chlorobium phaeobacteroides]MBL6956739.1 TolC family protein [Chlorobium phaeobacteroides]